MIEGKLVGVEHLKEDRKLRVHVEIESDRLSEQFQLGNKIILVGDQGYHAASKLVDRGSQYLLVPSPLRVDGERTALAKKVELSRPNRTIFVFKVDG
ncbi:MAG: hypothetical protein QF415_14440 [Candidatus Undinarchaeales archaeon]|jgi:hypothetical protein|nr:hypothetical protein [Candidatus Undinarchaeales archaeon]MDP7493191.1 hypothetical protein [Candidatus Undinarchaeales archaeon]